jgi:putative peptidoglycan lipid II flippase
MHKLRNLAISTAIVSTLNLLGKALGMVKTLVIAWTFGASGLVDAFMVAYVLPTVLPTVLKGMITTAFIPRFMRSLSGTDKPESWRGANTLFTVCVALFFTGSVVLAMFAAPLVSAVAPGLPVETHRLAATLTQLMAAAALFLGINAILSAIAYARQHFVYASLESAVTNSFVIAGCLVFGSRYGIAAVAVSVVAGFIAQTILLCVANWTVIRSALRPAFAFGHDDFRAPIRHMAPLAIGAIGAVATGIVDQVFASHLDAGSIAILGYATMLALIPTEIFGQAIRTTFYPILSRNYADGNLDELRQNHIRGLRLYLIVMVPSMAILIGFAEPAVAVLFERGSFAQESTHQTALVIMALSVGLLSGAVSWFNFGVFHALVQPWIPVTLGLLGVVLNIILTWVLVRPFGVFGIALATSITLIITSIVTIALLTRRLKINIVSALVEPSMKVVIMTTVMLVFAILFGKLAVTVTGADDRFWTSACQLFGIIPGVVAFIIVGAMLRLTEVRSALIMLDEKLRRRQSRLFRG